MKNKLYIGHLFAVFALQLMLASGLPAQSNVMRAQIRGDGSKNGKCTFEVEVDIVAEVEIRGDQGRVRTISGSPASWRRLVCNQPLPANPTNFRFQGIDGRGRQTLIQDPNSNGGVAVIRIEDQKSGREGYTGDILWSGSGRGDNNGGGWGNNGGGWGNNGGGWGNGGGSNNSNAVTGRGAGNFTRNGGPNYNLSNVEVRVDRSQRTVSASFNVNGGQSVNFNGTIVNMNNDTLQAALVSGTNRGDTSQASGQMRMQIGPDGRPRSIRMEGSVAGGDFRLNWNGR